MKRVLITGATGMVGGLVLRRCLGRDDVAGVTCVVRRSTGMAHPKLNEVITDMADVAGIADELAGCDVCFYCIGVYTGVVPKDEFRRITVDQVRAFGTVLRKASPGAALCFLSGQGADRSEHSRVMFARDKGAAENALVRLGFPRLHVFRPGYIFPVEPRKEPNAFYSFFRALWKYFLRFVYPNGGLSSHQLADAMVRAGLDGGDREVYSNRDIRQMAGA
jgi:uncharacterized protein YbjT (DUF2867 family)